MGLSIDELKASAASRAELQNVSSSASMLQASGSGFGLNLSKDPIRTRFNLSKINSMTDSRAFPIPITTVSNSNTSNVAPHENLRATAQTINGLIQKDKIQTDLGELLNGTALFSIVNV